MSIHYALARATQEMITHKKGSHLIFLPLPSGWPLYPLVPRSNPINTCPPCLSINILPKSAQLLPSLFPLGDHPTCSSKYK